MLCVWTIKFSTVYEFILYVQLSTHDAHLTYFHLLVICRIHIIDFSIIIYILYSHTDSSILVGIEIVEIFLYAFFRLWFLLYQVEEDGENQCPEWCSEEHVQCWKKGKASGDDQAIIKGHHQVSSCHAKARYELLLNGTLFPFFDWLSFELNSLSFRMSFQDTLESSSMLMTTDLEKLWWNWMEG